MGLIQAQYLFPQIQNVGAVWVGRSSRDIAAIVNCVDSRECVLRRKILIAAQAPGVARARAYWTWDPAQQRMLTRIYVGDSPSAINAANIALAGASDPNRPLQVKPAVSVTIGITFTLIIDPAYVWANLLAAVTAALIDPDAGLLGANAIQIGQVIYESQIYQACVNVQGTVAVHDLQVSGISATGPAFRLEPGEGGYLLLPSQNLIINQG